MFKESKSIIFVGDYEGVEIPQSMVFPGGEVGVRVGADHHSHPVCVEARLRNSNDVLELLSVWDALKRGRGISAVELCIPYVPYARQDRVCSEGEALGASVMAGLINSLGAFMVTVFDPHSDVAPALINNCRVVHQSEFVIRALAGFDGFVIAPDAGAEKKATTSAKALNCELITARKTRNPQTGEITGTVVDCSDLNGKDCLIVDDICDGGKTFTELAKILKERGAGKITLFVTHGIFSRGFDVFNGLIDEIYYTNSLAQHPGKLSSFIHKKELNNA